MEKPVPLTVACVTVRLEPPELVRTSVRLLVVPTGNVPKLRLEGLAARVPGDGLGVVLVPVPVPVPVKGSLAALPERQIENARLAFTVAALCGVKETVKVRLWPGCSVIGSGRLLSKKLALLTVALETFTESRPVLETVADKLLVCPTVTEPNDNEAGATVIRGRDQR